MSATTVLLDTNIWRYLVDHDGTEEIRRAAKRNNIKIVACPAVVYECLRIGDPALRRKLAKALTRPDWLRPMPEAFVYAEKFRYAVASHRPEWLIERPQLRGWNQNRSDWISGLWKRVREQPHLMSRVVDKVGGESLITARSEAQLGRKQMLDLKVAMTSVDLRALGSYSAPVPGWDGESFEAWRERAATRWWNDLFVRKHDTTLDWVAPWVDLPRVRADRAGWVSFWTREVREEEVPHEWLSWAMSLLQATRKTTLGTPVDNQITAYLFDYQYFVTSDKAFVECVLRLSADCVGALAQPSLAPAGAACVVHIAELFAKLGALNVSL